MERGEGRSFGAMLTTTRGLCGPGETERMGKSFDLNIYCPMCNNPKKESLASLTSHNIFFTGGPIVQCLNLIS